MKTTICIFLCLFFSIQVFGQHRIDKDGLIILKGIHQGKDLYVQNPFAGSGVGFCVYEVTVNGKTGDDWCMRGAPFSIVFYCYGIDIGDSVVVKIKHKLDCKPKILNPEIFLPKSTFTILNIGIDNQKILNWTSEGEQGSLDYIIEQFRWNKWIKVGVLLGKGSIDTCTYSFDISTDLHSGKNRFRIKQVGYIGKPRYSKSVSCSSTAEKVNITSNKVTKYLKFSAKTKFEIYDIYGNIIKKGNDYLIDCRKFKPAAYYVNYDNTTEKIIKVRK